ncbi:MAG: peptidylprolyl isomerase [Planctomycetota bacterium]
MRRQSQPHPLSRRGRNSSLTGLLFLLGLGGVAHAADGKLEHRVSHLLVAKKEQAYEIRNEVLRATDRVRAFRAAARKHSLDVTTRRIGGSLDWIGAQSGLDKRFLAAALRTKKGKISAPVRSRFGWHLILVHDTRGTGEPPELEPDDILRGDTKQPKDEAKAVRIVERFVQAMGGKKTVSALKDRKHRLEHAKYSGTEKTVAYIAYFRKGEAMIREEWKIPGFQQNNQELAFTQLYDGVSGWVEMYETVSPLVGRTLATLAWNKSLCHALVSSRKDGYSMSYVAEEQVKIGGYANEDGKTVSVDVIEVVDFCGKDTVRYSFSKETGLLVKKAWSGEKNGAAQAKETYYDDYRSVPFDDHPEHQLRVPLHERTYVNGTFDTEGVYSEVKFNSGLKDELFQKPTTGEPRKKAEL